MKIDRKAVYQKYGGRCAYCGEEIPITRMHVDHMKPIWRDTSVGASYKGSDDFDNLMPSCAPCNLWKSVHPLEEFRAEIAAQVERLRLRSANFRLAERYGLVAENKTQVKFYFELAKHTEGQL